MTLTEIMKACEVENEILKGEPIEEPFDAGDSIEYETVTRFPSATQLATNLSTTNNLIKKLALHVKQLRLDLNTREMCGGEK